jgi:fructose-1,6-bisphosphatase/inositol monophosphatase family enzyme
MNIDHDAVVAVIRDTAEQEILPLWCNLQQHQIEFKSPGDVVTVADRACEDKLSKALVNLLPGSLVLGEESVHRDPSLMKTLESERPVWVIDPLDGTSNFAAGEGPIAVMVCLTYKQKTVAAWIYDHVQQTMLQAELGAGCSLNGAKLATINFSGATADINGALSTKYLPELMKPKANTGARSLGVTRASGCAGFDYRALVTGEYQFVFYYRTLVWDHAPGVLIAQESGACTGRLDGTPYLPASNKLGLICASDKNIWGKIRNLLVEP